MSTKKKYIGVRELAEMVGVSQWTVRQWVKSGKLVPTILPGGTIRFKIDHVNNWLENREIVKA